PNGNTLICTGGVSGMGGGSGRVFEINASGTVVWDLTGFPVSTEGVRYAFGYLGGTGNVAVETSPVYSTQQRISIATNSLTGQVRIGSNGGSGNARLSLFSLAGNELIRSVEANGTLGWDLGSQPSGQYLAKISSGGAVAWERVTIRR
ncbi:MAG: T9SS type A sorting domain-containing protein, partial [Chitinispirillaceae bacterium]|nr:T9SS type A sorting domain-containing protein [Chitinispirillaceae bacterium]